ncbi:MAG: leucine-rich repeat protein [Eubacterium sp.]|nr:leucine-rich repeat protein [Eubacterium sp.]
MRISKKILAAFLAALMAISMMPFTVFAAPPGSNTSGTDIGGGISIGGGSTAVGEDPYLTFTGTESFSIKTNNNAKNWNGTLQYSTNASTWTTWNGTSQISSNNNVLYLRGTGNTQITGSNNTSKCWVITTQGTVACSGDIRTLLNYAEPESSSMGAYCFAYLFYNCTSLTAAPDLPATILAEGCYHSMFRGCTSLTMAPELPATELESRCYQSMFNGCANLTTAPELPATTLANNCYYEMFRGCTSLTTAPALPATSLATYCYSYMFDGCTSLTTAPVLPATTLANYCYQSMFNGCKNLTTAPALPSTSLASNCYYFMFNGCTNLTTAPALPATSLAPSCYYNMFNGCANLTTAPELPATTLAEQCYRSMFQGCTSLTTAPELPATELANYCYYNMFKGCRSLTTAPELPATTLASNCYYSMFQDCTSLTTPSELPATDLTDFCYYTMFRDCTGIKLSTEKTAEYSVPYSIPKGGTGTEGTYSLTDMFTSTGGTFKGTPSINTTYYIPAPAVTGVAEVNGVKYYTFEEALEAISDVTTATHSKAADPTYEYKTYKANGTIKLLANTTSNGVIIDSGSNLTIDFNNKTLDINAKPVGSNGTESAAMQLLKDSDITFKNGTLTSTYTYASTDTEYIQRLIQNYSDLTLDNMTVGMKGNFMNQLMMSNCNGDVTITDSTVSAPDFSHLGYTDATAAESLGARAMSVGTFSTYTGVDVTVTDSTINGYVNIDNTGANGTAALTLDSSYVNGNIVDKNMNNSTVTNTESNVAGIPAGYEWNASNILAPIADGFNLTVEDCIHMNLYVNAAAYDADEITVTYSDPDKQNGGTKTETFAVSDLTQDAKGRYAVKILAAPAQMRDTVTVTAGSHTYTTTVAAYCEAIIAQSNNYALVNLAKAMLDYGKACSDDFNYNESAFENQAYYNTDDVSQYIEAYSLLNSESANGKFKSYAYIAKSVPALRIYLNTTEQEAVALGGKAIVNGEATQIMVDPDGDVCVDITGILAEDLNAEYTVEFNGGELKLNALQFAKAKGGNTALGRSMYNYYTAADAYFV